MFLKKCSICKKIPKSITETLELYLKQTDRDIDTGELGEGGGGGITLKDGIENFK